MQQTYQATISVIITDETLEEVKKFLQEQGKALENTYPDKIVFKDCHVMQSGNLPKGKDTLEHYKDIFNAHWHLFTP